MGSSGMPSEWLEQRIIELQSSIGYYRAEASKLGKLRDEQAERLRHLEQMAVRGYAFLEDWVQEATDDDHYAVDGAYREKLAEVRAYLAEYADEKEGIDGGL